LSCHDTAYSCSLLLLLFLSRPIHHSYMDGAAGALTGGGAAAAYLWRCLHSSQTCCGGQTQRNNSCQPLRWWQQSHQLLLLLLLLLSGSCRCLLLQLCDHHTRLMLRCCSRCPGLLHGAWKDPRLLLLLLMESLR
jgi:hypothetical protein